MSKVRIGIVGHGFVGKAVEFGFKTSSTDLYIVDPIYGNSVSDLKIHAPQFVFVCVPTPMSSSGAIDSSIVESVFEQVSNWCYEPVMILKSTVTPDVVQKLQECYSEFVYNPEFLSERNANLDFINPPMLVIGGSEKNIMRVRQLYKEHSRCAECPTFGVDPATASMVKYAINSFLASKVLFFNQLKDVFEKTGAKISWEQYTDIIATDQRVGRTHMQVPGPDGKKFFGGACFTKDTMALAHYSRDAGAEFTLLEDVIMYNTEGRTALYGLDSREKAQNVDFSAIYKIRKQQKA